MKNERLEKLGVGGLLNHELISFVTGIKEEELIDFDCMLDIRERIDLIKGTKLQKQKLKAFFELTKRFSKEEKRHIKKIQRPRDVYELLVDDFIGLQVEQFRILLLDTKNQVKKIDIISEGTLNASIVHPREVYKSAVLNSASCIMLVHNHPSGDPNPSREDVNITNRLVEAGDLMGITVLDHIVIANRNYYSFKENNLL